MTLDEELDDMEQRSRGSQKARAHVVTLDRCPCCGTRLAASLVAAIKRGEVHCPRRPRRRPIVDVPLPDVFSAAAEALAAHDQAWGAGVKRLLAVVLTAATLIVAAPSADAAVPYSWWCYRSGRPAVHVYTAGGVGYWTAYQGYSCVGGFWRNV